MRAKKKKNKQARKRKKVSYKYRLQKREELTHSCVSHGKLQKGDKVIIVARVSTRSQRDNLDGQANNLRKYANECGAIIVDIVPHVGKGQYLRWLKKAVKKAKRYNAKIIAESVSRLIRSGYYHPKERPYEQADLMDLEHLKEMLGNIELTTVLSPTADAKEERASAIKRGQQEKNGKTKKQRREEQTPIVIELYKQKRSLRQIEMQTGVPYRTVGRWLKDYKKTG